MKISGLALFNIALAIVLLACSLWVSTTADYGTWAAPTYDPWCDLDDDGDIDIKDVAKIAKRYGALGEPFAAKAALQYDSGWVNIADKAGQYFNITHDLNSTDIIVGIQGKTTLDGGAHQRHFGLTGYTLEWNRTYGGTYYEFPLCLIQTSDGGYAIAGETLSFGAGSADFWLVKTDTFGRVQWSQTYGGTGEDHGTCVVQTSDGGYAIAGYTGSYTDYDFYLVKTSADGKTLWSHTYGGTDSEHAYSLVQTVDGGYAIAGDTMSFGAGSEDFWLVKTDSSGNLEWSQTYGGTDSEHAYSLVQTVDMGYAIAGETGSLGAGYTDFWLVKTDSSGNVEWGQVYGGTFRDSAQSVIQTSDGGYAITGYTMSFGGGNDFWLVKTNASGDVEWSQVYGGTGWERAYSLVQTSDGGYAIAGERFVGDSDLLLIKTDATGSMQWTKTLGGISGDDGQSVVQTGNGGYTIAGFTGSFGSGGGDFWLVHTGVGSGLAWTDSTVNTTTLYRGATDPYWNYVRVRIWKIKENP